MTRQKLAELAAAVDWAEQAGADADTVRKWREQLWRLEMDLDIDIRD